MVAEPRNLNEWTKFGDEVYWYIKDIWPPSYQRGLNETHVEELVREFNPAQFDRVLLNQRADKMVYVVDGQHRVEAMKRLKHSRVPARLTYGLTEDQEREWFLSRNSRKGNKPLTPYDRHHAGDAESRIIDEVVGTFGFRVGRQGGHNHTYGTQHVISAILALRYIYRSPVLGGKSGLGEVLRVITTAWGHSEPGSVHQHMLRGMHLFLQSAHEDRAYDEERLIKAITPYLPQKLLADASILAPSMVGGRKIPRSIVTKLRQRYNYNKRGEWQLTFPER